MKQIKLPFNVTCLMEILKIEAEEQRLTKYYMIKDLTLLKLQYMMGIEEVLPQWFINFLNSGSNTSNYVKPAPFALTCTRIS